MGYAVVFLLLAGMTCSGFVFISSGYKRLEVTNSIKEHVVFNNMLSLQLGANWEPCSKSIVHSSGDSSIITVKNWGAYKAISATTYSGNIRKEKSALSANQSSTNYPVLFLTDRKQSIKVSGTTIIEGDVSMSSRKFEHGYIGGNSIKKEHSFEGQFIDGSKTLPSLNINPLDLIPKENTIAYLPDGICDTSFSFHKDTRKWHSDSYIMVLGNLKGNIIIESQDSIIVDGNSNLENVLLVAPLIRIREGFVGSLQAISESSIICEKNTKLNYPSSLMIISDGQNDMTKAIKIEEGSSVIGAIMLWDKYYNFRHPPYLFLGENALFSGLIYNQGESEIRGVMIGSLITNELTLNAGGGVYKSHLFNVKLSKVDLPKEFLYPNWLGDKNTNPSKLISCF